MLKLLIIVDMQNDFIDGSLANPDAQAIVKPICDYAKDFDGDIIFTLDTHTDDYLETYEGKYLPIKHCVRGTKGWAINKDIFDTVQDKETPYYTVEKPNFGYKDWEKFFERVSHIDEIIMVGTCTDICVISNALILKSVFPETKITVLKDLCSGLTKEKHEAALEVMRSCQIEVK